MVVFGKSGCIRAKVALFALSSCCFYAKVVVFEQSGFIRANWLYSGKSCCNQANWFYSCIF